MTDIVQNEWQNGVCECYKDFSTCIFGYFCAPCLMCKNAGDLGQDQCLYCFLACCFPICGIWMLRQKAREAYGIEGDGCKDFCCACCLPACVNCQIQNEIKARNGYDQ